MTSTEIFEFSLSTALKPKKYLTTIQISCFSYVSNDCKAVNKSDDRILHFASIVSTSRKFFNRIISLISGYLWLRGADILPRDFQVRKLGNVTNFFISDSILFLFIFRLVSVSIYGFKWVDLKKHKKQSKWMNFWWLCCWCTVGALRAWVELLSVKELKNGASFYTFFFYTWSFPNISSLNEHK